MPPGLREQRLKEFMRARSAVSLNWSNMAGISELKLPQSSRTPALRGKAHYQKFIDYLPNVFFIGGDLQFYVCVRDRDWIRDLPATAGAA